METRHIRMGYEEAILAKKQLLSTQINLLQTIKKVKAYRFLRSKEMIIKNKLAINLTSLRNKIKAIEATFPRQEIKIEKIESKEKEKEDKGNVSIQKELREIQEKLAKLQ